MMMAAGEGRRIRPFSEVMPKPFLPLFNIPVIQFNIDQAVELFPKSLVINLNHLPQVGLDEIKKLDTPDFINIRPSVENILLGGAGGLKQAQKYFEPGPILIGNSDVITDLSFADLINRHNYLKATQGVLATFALLKSNDIKSKYREILIDKKKGTISKLGELKTNSIFYSGFCVLEQEALTDLTDGEPADFVEKIITPLILNQKAGYYLDRFFWSDMGSPELWLQAHMEILQLLETGQISKRIMKRIEKNNIRRSDQAWSKVGLNRYYPVAHTYCGTSPLNLSEGQVVYDSSIDLKNQPGITFSGKFWISK